MRDYGYSMMENLNSTSFERLPYCSDWCLQLAHNIILLLNEKDLSAKTTDFIILGKSCIKRSVICTMTWQFLISGEAKQNYLTIPEMQ